MVGFPLVTMDCGNPSDVSRSNIPKFAVVRRLSMRRLLRFSKASFVSSEMCNFLSLERRVRICAIWVWSFTFDTRTASKPKSFRNAISWAPPLSKGFVRTIMKLRECSICDKNRAMLCNASFFREGAMASSRFSVIISASLSSIRFKCLRFRGFNIILERLRLWLHEAFFVLP